METVSRSYQSWYAYGKELLAAAGITDAAQDAWLLLEYAAAIDRSFFLMHGSEPMDEADAEEYHLLLKKRTERTPVQYLTEEAWFWGRNFYVSPDVLIPRLDTETMIDYLGRCQINGSRVLDMCTGSGAIGVSVAALVPEAIVTMTDVSEAAIRTAMSNAELNEVNRKCVFLKGDMFDALPADREYDMIISNPPYIETDVIDTLSIEVRDHEPRMALDGGKDGLDYYRVLASDASMHLRSGGVLVMEIGADQAGSVKRLMMKNKAWVNVRKIQDLAGLDRAIIAERK